MDDKTRVIAFYLPQYHAIPENNEWWGDGFTEWVNVKKARPLFDGHSQPRRPLNNHYYDLSDLNEIEWQVELAKSHGIHGFCHYHYWFDGKQLLEKPTNLFLSNKHLDLQFCLAWANESWSRRWDGQDHHILQLQSHQPGKDLWGRHFDYLINAWLDDRAVKIDNKPVFIIYRPHKIRQIAGMFDYWQTRIREYGFDGIYFLTMKQYAFPDQECLRHFDGTILFQPFDAMHSMQPASRDDVYKKLLGRILPEAVTGFLQNIKFHYKNNYGRPQLFDYDAVWETIVNRIATADATIWPGAFVDWDNTARYGRRSMVFKDVNPDKFEYWFSRLVSAMRSNQHCMPYVFINAWNEWAEGTYLEPDDRYKMGYLQAIKNSLLDSENNQSI